MHFAFIFRGGKIIAEGKNGFSGGRKLSDSCMTTHAEIDAIKNVRKYKKRKRHNLSIVSTAFDGHSYRISKPCYNCCKSLIEYGIEWVRWYDGSEWIMSRTRDIILNAKLSSGDRPKK
jgi:deoxycytidylate deaminase